MKERREYLRIGAQLPVTHRLRGMLLGATSTSEDISAGGVSFTMVQRVDLGMVLNLEIAIPGLRKPVSALGKVVWQADSKEVNNLRFIVGTEFTAIDNCDKNKLSSYITYAAKVEAYGKIAKV